jgi:hypothetical protein
LKKGLRMRQTFIVIYAFALTGILVMAGYHFFLPTHMHWAEGMVDAPVMLSWALNALNFLWSLVTLCFSGLLLIHLRKPRVDAGAKRTASNMFCLYWVLHAVFLYLNPPMLPPQLQWIPMLFLVFPVLTVSMLLLGNWIFRETDG